MNHQIRNRFILGFALITAASGARYGYQHEWHDKMYSMAMEHPLIFGSLCFFVGAGMAGGYGFMMTSRALRR
jgi:hypothetical protein